ncbi:MBL fold metallo-hydrolase [Alteribacillus sp. HJP-4]|uniref:MBL fold metallo-hydrolase n=1 Tax=Alteribacillus sp. HJP-4 TaxID=2775394 RepID=UPI0035CD1CF2
MDWKQLPLGPLQTNCYILYDVDKAVVFDPGGDAHILERWLAEKQLKPIAIVLTHAHFDHIGAVQELREKWGISVFLHENEKGWLTDPSKNGSALFLGNEAITAAEADEWITGEEMLHIGPFEFKIYETPGHSPGSVSFYHKGTSTIFSGDVLFYGGIGRTDLPGGNHEQLIRSIHDKLLSLPEDTAVACGHGPVTTIEDEMNSNPFLNGF